MKLLFSFFCLIAVFACNNEQATKAVSMPALPPSAPAAATALKGKTYTVSQTGLGSAFSNDSSIRWASAIKDTGAMYKDFMASARDFSLQFKNDTTVMVTLDKKQHTGTYKVEKDEQSGAINLRLTYTEVNPDMGGGNEPVELTYTYTIRGLDKDALLLQAPRSYNDASLLLLMK